jgi:P-type conjugative transfer protein TrbJ
MKRLSAILVISLIFCSVTAYAQIATIDAGNIVQSTISAEQAITQTAQQLQQYQAQLQQLQNQIQNTTNPSSFQWDNANATINNVLASVNTLNSFKTQAGSIATYLAQYSNATQYQTTSCIGTGGCTGAQIQQINASQYTGSDSQKTANDNMMITLNAQQQQLQNDASNVATLQQNAQGSTGQMEAMQAANQLASNQAVQLMQIRSLMIAQQTAEATRAETVVDKEAQQQAASDAFIGSPPDTSTPYNILSYTGGASQ